MRWVSFSLLLISIHALRKESDETDTELREHVLDISIHALRKESDSSGWMVMPSSEFQSTLSVRRATNRRLGLPEDWIFQSTLSVRRATRRGRSRAGR